MNTPYIFRAKNAHRCGGAVAVETALILPAIVIMFMATFLVGRAYWQYHIIQNASATAARYVAKGNWPEIASGSRKATAEIMVKNLLRDAGLSNEAVVSVYCPPRPDCNSSLPLPAVSVLIDISGDEANFMFPGGSFWTVTTVSYPN